MFVSDRFKNYGYSQLVELLPVSDNDLIKFNSGMSVREIKEKKKVLKEKSDSRVSFQTSGKENTARKLIEKEDEVITPSSDDGFVNISLFNTEYTVDEFGKYVCDIIKKYCRDGRKYKVRITVNDIVF